jgi:hypothetical protein
MFIAWTTALRKILMLDYLRTGNIIVMDWCCMCKKSGESINHLLLHCELARDLQSSLFNLFGVDCVKSRRVTIVDEQGGQVGCCSILEVLRLAHLCLIWCIWRERKAQSFKDKETSVV